MKNAAALDDEAAEPLRKRARLAAVYGVMAAALAALIPYAYTLENLGARVAQARVIGFEKLGGEDRYLVLTEFVDHEGRTRTTRDSASMMPDAKVGDIVPVIYDPDEETFARIVNSGERLMRASFQFFVALLLVLVAALLGSGLRHRTRARRLLREGRVERGQAVRVETRTLPIANAPPIWRVRASWLDPATATWREVRSAWQSSAQWATPDREPHVLIYVDSRDPGSAWLPVSSLRVPATHA